MRKRDSLQMLRAVAAIPVVLFHVRDVSARRGGHVPFGGMSSSGRRGVDLFFVLSEFIIGQCTAPVSIAPGGSSTRPSNGSPGSPPS